MRQRASRLPRRPPVQLGSPNPAAAKLMAGWNQGNTNDNGSREGIWSLSAYRTPYQPDKPGFRRLPLMTRRSCCSWRGMFVGPCLRKAPSISGSRGVISPDDKPPDSRLLHVAQHRVESQVPGQKRPSSRSYSLRLPWLNRQG
jgi:hypothetical protein